MTHGPLVLFYAVSVVCVPFSFGVYTSAGCGIRLYRFLIIAFSSTYGMLIVSDLN